MNLVVPNAIFFSHVCSLLEEGKTVTFEVKGASMRPFIEGGRDSVCLKKEEFEVGDAVLAQLPAGNYVLHRVKSIDADEVTLKGDGNLEGVEKCSAGSVKGKVLQIIKAGGRTVDVSKPSFRRKVRRWTRSPYIYRRIVLSILRRWRGIMSR